MIAVSSKDKIKILVCTHKAGEFPNDDIYLPLHVGKALSNIDLGIQGDDTGDNISVKNKSFCELTGLYWAWKNIKTIYPNIQYIGLCHYRRYFALDRKKSNRYGRISVRSLPDIKNYKNILLPILRSNKQIIVKPKTHAWSLQIEYSRCHYSDDYITLKEVVNDLYPEYNFSFNRVMELNNRLSYFNMFVSSYSFLEDYCEWLFAILFELEKRINISNYNEYQARVFGFLSEYLLNVFVYHHNTPIAYRPYFFIENNETNFDRGNIVWNIITNIKYELSFLLQDKNSTKALARKILPRRLYDRIAGRS
jgi:hypothetical protein